MESMIRIGEAWRSIVFESIGAIPFVVLNFFIVILPIVGLSIIRLNMPTSFCHLSPGFLVYNNCSQVILYWHSVFCVLAAQSFFHYEPFDVYSCQIRVSLFNFLMSLFSVITTQTFRYLRRYLDRLAIFFQTFLDDDEKQYL